LKGADDAAGGRKLIYGKDPEEETLYPRRTAKCAEKYNFRRSFCCPFFLPFFFFFALVCPSSLSMYFLFQSTAAAQKISEINTKGKQHEKERHQHQQKIVKWDIVQNKN
jgi:hypothetical protein